MSEVRVFWDPRGVTLDSLGRKRFLRVTDGDTPYVSFSIRMLSIDTPELHYPGNQDPARHDERLAELAEWIRRGEAPVDDALAAHLHPRLATGRAGSLQKAQGEAATRAFEELLEARLSRPSGRRRAVFLRSADQPFDQYGRVLAYMAPSYSRAERERLSRRERATFNLLMVASGWAAPFPIYPNLPRHEDLVLLREEARRAVTEGRGAWADPAMLTGYEFRMCYRLWEVTRRLRLGRRLDTAERRSWVHRYCVDMTSREIFDPADYHRVAPYDRLFVWPRDVPEAVARLNLEPPRQTPSDR